MDMKKTFYYILETYLIAQILKLKIDKNFIY